MTGRAAALVGRVLDATYAQVAEQGLAALTVEAVAVRAGASRATVYRHFPGGRDELVERTIRREVGRFLAAVLDAAPPAGGDLADHVAGLMTAARRLLDEHDVLQRLLVEEADAIVPSLAPVLPVVEQALSEHLRSLLEHGIGRAVRAGVDVEEAADHCARLVLSYVGSSGRWDLDDAAEARRLVRSRLLAGVLV